MGILEAGALDHVGIAVPDLEAAWARYRDLLGAELEHRERLTDQGVEVAFLRLPGGATRIELVAPLQEGEGPVGRYLQRRGQGLHHICVRVEDVGSALESLRAAGVPLVDDRPRPGAAGSRIAFVHPRGLGGVLLELKEKGPPEGP